MSDRNVSPLTLRMMLAAYYSTEPEEDVGKRTWYSEAGQRIVRWLENNGLIDGSGHATGKGRAWVERMLTTPLPRQAWVFDDPESTYAAFASSGQTLTTSDEAAPEKATN